MNTYAVVENGAVVNVILWDGDEKKWSPQDEQIVVEIPEGVAVTTGVEYGDEGFVIPDTPTLPAPTPSPEDIIKTNSALRSVLLSQAAIAIAPLQDAVDLEEATEKETSLLKKWKEYRVAVSRVDLTAVPVSWPELPA